MKDGCSGRKVASRTLSFGSALTGVGASMVLSLSLLFEPMTASETMRQATTVAFAMAQTGLALIAVAVFRRL